MTLLDLADTREPNVVGGKAAALGALVRAGFRVPAGFVATAGAENQAVLARFDALDCEFVAVRSSAVNEDGTGATWAGQLDTFLYVDRSRLLGAIRRCQTSAHSVRAQAYAAQRNQISGNVAVLVQQMVASEVSGVAFSVHPVTQRPEHVLVEAGLGLGEAVVSGEITPDNYTVDKTSGQLLDHLVAVQQKQLVQAPSGGTTWQKLTPPNAKPKLSPNQLAEIATTAGKIEQLFGFPVDVEWVYAESKLYILQSRAITTLN
jgi:phosphoenolpyruvate synthase/pyruvate phosphate dikinase